MRLLDYVQQLEDFKGKRDRVQYALTQVVTGYPREVLAKDLGRLEALIKDLESLRVAPQPVVVRIAANASLTLPAGESAKLAVEYTLADGTLVTDPVYVHAAALFRDFDALYNNQGFITSINLAGYKGENATFTITKTVNGFDIFDEVYTQGLHITQVEDEFVVADINGESIGFTFTTDGAEQTGDNWTVHVTVVSDGMTFESDNTSIVRVENGVVYGLTEGSTFITVRNGDLVVPVPITVEESSQIPPPSE